MKLTGTAIDVLVVAEAVVMEYSQLRMGLIEDPILDGLLRSLQAVVGRHVDEICGRKPKKKTAPKKRGKAHARKRKGS